MDEWQLSRMTVKTVPAFSALVQQAQLTVPKIPQFAEQATTSLVRLTEARRIEVIAPPVFVYTGAGTGAEDLLMMQVAFVVGDDLAFETTDGPSPTALLRFEAFRCASFDFTGPAVHLAEAYAPAMNALRAGGHTPREQSREVYKRWAGYDSRQNTVEVQLGIR